MTRKLLIFLAPLLLFAGGPREVFPQGPIPAPPIPAPTPVVPTPQPTPAPIKPPAEAPQVVTPPAPPVVPADPTYPRIVLLDRLGNDVPKTGRVGEIVVLSAEKSQNVRLLKFEFVPPITFDWDARTWKLVFSVAAEGVYTLSVVATSPDGGLATETHQITFGDATAATPAALSMPKGPVNYTPFVVAEARKMTQANRKGDALAMVSAFSSAIGLVRTGGIRDREELFRYTDKQLESLLGGDLDDCTPFIHSLLEATGREGGDLGRLTQVWQQIADGLQRASK